MVTDFERQLIQSIPFKEGDHLFAKYQRGAKSIIALGVTTPEKMLDVLADAHIDTDIRKNLITFAAWLKYYPALHSFIRIATSELESLDLRRTAIIDLAILGRSKAFPTLKNLAKNAPNPLIRIAAISSFEVAPSRRALDVLVQIAYRDKNYDVRARAIRAISSIPLVGKELAFAVLFAKFMDTKENVIVRAYAIEGFANLRIRDAIDIAVDNLDNDSSEIRYMCAYALGLLGNISHIPLLKTRITDNALFEDWGTVSDAAAQAIEELTSHSQI